MTGRGLMQAVLICAALALAHQFGLAEGRAQIKASVEGYCAAAAERAVSGL